MQSKLSGMLKSRAEILWDLEVRNLNGICGEESPTNLFQVHQVNLFAVLGERAGKDLRVLLGWDFCLFPPSCFHHTLNYFPVWVIAFSLTSNLHKTQVGRLLWGSIFVSQCGLRYHSPVQGCSGTQLPWESEKVSFSQFSNEVEIFTADCGWLQMLLSYTWWQIRSKLAFAPCCIM